MPLKKKDDGFEQIKLEAQEAGINIARAADGSYTASVVGGHTLEDYGDARALLDDMLALLEMDEKDDLFAYDNAEMGGYKVAVTGGATFEDESLAKAFAKAKESLLPKAVAQAPKKATTSETITSGEVLAPEKPNGQERAQMANDATVEALLDIAQKLTDIATQMRSPGAAAVPSVNEEFEEGEPATPTPARSRITRERGSKKGA